MSLRVTLMSPRPARDVSQPPLAAGTLKAYALSRKRLRAEADIDIVEGWAGEDPKALAARVLARRPDIAGFSCYVWNLKAVREACRRIRRARPGTLLVLGGPEVSPRPEAVLAEGWADVVARGEGEETFAELLEATLSGRKLSAVAGLTVRGKGGVVSTPERPLITDLSSIPSPYLTGVLRPAAGADIAVEVSRGCLYKCLYCTWNTSTVRYFPEKRVLGDLAFLAERSPRLAVQLVCTDFFFDPARARRLLRGLKPILGRPGLDWLTATWTYLGNLKTGLSDLRLKNFFLLCGVQSVNPEPLRRANRFFHKGKIEEAVARLRREAPEVHVQLELILGLPGDTFEGFCRTLDWTLSLKHDSILVQPLALFPDSKLRDRARRDGIEYDARPSYLVRAIPGFPRARMKAASFLAYAVSVLRSDAALRAALERWGDTLVGADPTPYLRPYQELLRRLRRSRSRFDLPRRYRVSRAEKLLSFEDWPRRVEPPAQGSRPGPAAARAFLDPLTLSSARKHAALDMRYWEHLEAVKAVRDCVAEASR